MASRALITGAAGFIGAHLAPHLVEQGLEVHGVDLPGVPAPADWPGQWHAGNVADASDMTAIVVSLIPICNHEYV